MVFSLLNCIVVFAPNKLHSYCSLWNYIIRIPYVIFFKYTIKLRGFNKCRTNPDSRFFVLVKQSRLTVKNQPENKTFLNDNQFKCSVVVVDRVVGDNEEANTSSANNAARVLTCPIVSCPSVRLSNRPCQEYLISQPLASFPQQIWTHKIISIYNAERARL